MSAQVAGRFLRFCTGIIMLRSRLVLVLLLSYLNEHTTLAEDHVYRRLTCFRYAPTSQVTIACPIGSSIAVTHAQFGSSPYRLCMRTTRDCLQEVPIPLECCGRSQCTIHVRHVYLRRCLATSTYYLLQFKCLPGKSDGCSKPLPTSAPSSGGRTVQPPTTVSKAQQGSSRFPKLPATPRPSRLPSRQPPTPAKKLDALVTPKLDKLGKYESPRVAMDNRTSRRRGKFPGYPAPPSQHTGSDDASITVRYDVITAKPHVTQPHVFTSSGTIAWAGNQDNQAAVTLQPRPGGRPSNPVTRDRAGNVKLNSPPMFTRPSTRPGPVASPAPDMSTPAPPEVRRPLPPDKLLDKGSGKDTGSRNPVKDVTEATSATRAPTTKQATKLTTTESSTTSTRHVRVTTGPRQTQRLYNPPPARPRRPQSRHPGTTSRIRYILDRRGRKKPSTVSKPATPRNITQSTNFTATEVRTTTTPATGRPTTVRYNTTTKVPLKASIETMNTSSVPITFKNTTKLNHTVTSSTNATVPISVTPGWQKNATTMARNRSISVAPVVDTEHMVTELGVLTRHSGQNETSSTSPPDVTTSSSEDTLAERIASVSISLGTLLAIAGGEALVFITLVVILALYLRRWAQIFPGKQRTAGGTLAITGDMPSFYFSLGFKEDVDVTMATKEDSKKNKTHHLVARPRIPGKAHPVRAYNVDKRKLLHPPLVNVAVQTRSRHGDKANKDRVNFNDLGRHDVSEIKCEDAENNNRAEAQAQPNTQPDKPPRKYFYEEACTAFNIPLEGATCDDTSDGASSGENENYAAVIEELSETISRAHSLRSTLRAAMHQRSHSESSAGSPRTSSMNNSLHSLDGAQSTHSDTSSRAAFRMDEKLRCFAEHELRKINEQIYVLFKGSSMRPKVERAQ